MVLASLVQFHALPVHFQISSLPQPLVERLTLLPLTLTPFEPL